LIESRYRICRGLEDPAPRIDERNALALKLESGGEIVRGQIPAKFGEALDRVEGGDAKKMIPIGRGGHGCSAKKYALVMPAQKLGGGPIVGRVRNDGEPLALVRVVVTAVLEFLLDPLADLDAQVLGHRDVAIVEKNVEIRPEQEPVRDEMRPRVRVGLDVRGFEDRKRALTASLGPSQWVHASMP
jgi:hypothetical protein